MTEFTYFTYTCCCGAKFAPAYGDLEKLYEKAERWLDRHDVCLRNRVKDMEGQDG